MVQFDAHGKWAESEYQPWVARTRKTVVQTPTINNRGFTDDISIFTETSKGMQTLLNMVQDFTTWCGMEINVQKKFLLGVDKDQKRREGHQI